MRRLDRRLDNGVSIVETPCKEQSFDIEERQNKIRGHLLFKRDKLVRVKLEPNTAGGHGVIIPEQTSLSCLDDAVHLLVMSNHV